MLMDDVDRNTVLDSVVDPHSWNPDPDTNPDLDTNPDPAFQVNSYPYPGFDGNKLRKQCL
jgi:hypothetical protein